MRSLISKNMVKINLHSFKSLAEVSNQDFTFSFAAIAFMLIHGGFFIYSRFFSGSTLCVSDIRLNSNFHYTHIRLIKTSVSSGETPITTNDLKFEINRLDKRFWDRAGKV